METVIEIKNLNKNFQSVQALKNINLSLKKGEIHGIVGANGSGKSTLLKVLYGEYDLDEGNIFWNDNEILGPKYNLVVGYDFMKYVAQEFDLMPFTSVAENIGKYAWHGNHHLAHINGLLTRMNW